MKNIIRDTTELSREIETRLGNLRQRQLDPVLCEDDLFLEIFRNIGSEFVTAAEFSRLKTATHLGVQLAAELLYYLERHAPKRARLKYF